MRLTPHRPSRTPHPLHRQGARRRALAAGAATVLALGLTGAGSAAATADEPATAAQASGLARVSPFLADQLQSLTGRATVMVHGTDLAAARAAVADAGLATRTEFEQIGVVVARGTADQVQAVRAADGVTYVEAGEAPIALATETSHQATRGLAAERTLTGADGTALTGRGVSVAVIDSGVDPTHPSFREPGGGSAVVANLKTICDPFEIICEVTKVPTFLDTDTLSVGGHGTHVSGIAVGRRVTLSDGEQVQGAARDAKLVSVSTGAALLIVGADAALNWVLENHEAPCGPGVPAATCPPIKVTNNSYGPTGGGEFDPESATVKLQRALAAEGVVTVWAAGNDGGDGSTSLTNPPSQDPTGGILGVASYDDLGTGTRDGNVSEFSSRGQVGRPSTYPDISAPGSDITSSCRPYLPICSTGLDFRNGPGPLAIGTFNTISGTSMAAPHVAGIVAQLYQADPGATPAEIEAALTSSAHKFTDGLPYAGGTSADKGHGLVDVVAAVAALTGS
ncbi:S8 family peptidase [Nocardioides nanhaiensis]|uniref:Peptidase S8/S53 domain-containing protein n=1 Tax=Nocardioides nanhaiensis TaxID=1476871 RepID=A0ABP8WXL7_9ACTN